MKGGLIGLVNELVFRCERKRIRKIVVISAEVIGRMELYVYEVCKVN